LVLVATTDRYDELVAVLPAPPAGSQLLRTKLTFSADDSRRLAAELWDLDGIAALYRQAIASLMVASSRHSSNRLRERRRCGHSRRPCFRCIVPDPDLPAELLPADWPLSVSARRSAAPSQSLSRWLATTWTRSQLQTGTLAERLDALDTERQRLLTQ
jgi:DNA-binding transcriptional regulator PaaX